MKTKRKALLLSLCAVLLVVATVMGTMAYLTAKTDEVKNTFTVGTAVAITLDEAKTDANGVKVDPEVRVKENGYKLMPGHNYTKDPTVHVTGESCYVFVKVDNGIADLELTGDTTHKTIAEQMYALGWKAVTVNGVTGLYIYTVNGEKAAVSGTPNQTDLKVFGEFTVKSDVDYTGLSAFNGKTITIKAYAVQKDGFEDMDPAAIWTTAGLTA